MRSVLALVSAAVLLSFPLAAGSQAQTDDEVDRDVAARISNMSKHLQFSTGDPDRDRLFDELDDWTTRVQMEIDAYVTRVLHPNLSIQRLEDRFRTILSAHKPDQDAGGPPLLRLSLL